MADGIPRKLGLIRVALNWPTATPRPVTNVLYVLGQRAFSSQTDANTCGAAIAAILALVPESVAAHNIPAPNFEAADYSPGGAYTGEGTVSSWTAPGDASEAPSAVSALISWSSAAPRYRGGHNRTYIGQVGTDFIANDYQMTNQGVVNMQGAITSVINELGTIGSSLGGPYSLVAVHTSGVLAGNTYTITGGIPQTTLATQRRRLRKVARHKKKTTTP
jgi:hypothetical protein